MRWSDVRLKIGYERDVRRQVKAMLGRACRTHASALPRTRALMADCCAFYDSMTTRGHVQHPSYTATCGFTREVAQSWATLTFAIWLIILGGQRNLFLVFGGTEVANNNRCRYRLTGDLWGSVLAASRLSCKSPLTYNLSMTIVTEK